ncbi:hypothetical protein QUF70_11210 [Desulfobacterales bacterium HSG17]|nr:hypothetical protein [Desulfobacterales bacterium HSG17]
MGLRQKNIEKTDSLELIYHWYEPYHKVGCIFFIVWDFLSISLYHLEIIKLFRGKFIFPQNFFALCVFFMLIIVPTYWMLVYLVNKTKVYLNESRVIVKNGPLPWWRNNLSFALKDIKYIWIEEHCPDSIEDMSRDVKAIMKNGEARNILLNMQNPEESSLVRSKINLWLIEMRRAGLFE